MKKIAFDSTVKAGRGQVSTRLGDEVALLHVETGVYFGLDAVGARVWEVIQQARPVQAVYDTILAEYNVEPVRWQTELFAFLEQLAAHGLIEIEDPATASKRPAAPG